jgi:hypothetical protein
MADTEADQGCLLATVAHARQYGLACHAGDRPAWCGIHARAESVDPSACGNGRWAMKTIYMVIAAAFLVSCGGSYDDEKRQEYIDKCVIEAGPHADKSNVYQYCLAKWRQSLREK